MKKIPHRTTHTPEELLEAKLLGDVVDTSLSDSQVDEVDELTQFADTIRATALHIQPPKELLTSILRSLPIQKEVITESEQKIGWFDRWFEGFFRPVFLPVGLVAVLLIALLVGKAFWYSPSGAPTTDTGSRSFVLHEYEELSPSEALSIESIEADYLALENFDEYALEDEAFDALFSEIDRSLAAMIDDVDTLPSLSLEAGAVAREAGITERQKEYQREITTALQGYEAEEQLLLQDERMNDLELEYVSELDWRTIDNTLSSF